MPPPDLRERLASYLPFAVVAVVGQLERGLATRLHRPRALCRQQPAADRDPDADRGPPRHAAPDLHRRVGPLHVVGGAPHAGVGRHGERNRSPVVHAGRGCRPLRQALGVGRLRRLHAGRHPGRDARLVRSSAATTLRRLFLTAAIAAMLSVAIHVIRGRLEESSARTERMLRHEEALNAAARQLVQLSEPPQITALGAQLALGIASPDGSEILRASYFRIEDDMVVIDAQFDQLGTIVEERWPLHEHPALQEAVESLQPVAARLDSDTRRADGAGDPPGVGRHARRLGPGLPGRGAARGARHRQHGVPPSRTSASSAASPWATSWNSRFPTGPPTAR